MAEKWIDISVSLKNGLLHWPGDPQFSLEKVKSIKNGDSANVSLIKTGVHSGTHVDAPYHFLENGQGIDLIPLDAMMGIAKVIEIKYSQAITSKELYEHKIFKGDRIIFKTINSRTLWEKEKFNERFVSLSNDAAKYIAEKGIKTIGVDYLSVGAFKKDGAEIHKILLSAGIWVIEGLNLYGNAPGKYNLICLSLKILGSDAAPARAIIRKT